MPADDDLDKLTDEQLLAAVRSADEDFSSAQQELRDAEESLRLAQTKLKTVEKLRKRLIALAASRPGINRRQMARELGMHEVTIYKIARAERGGEPLMTTKAGNRTRAARAIELERAARWDNEPIFEGEPE